MIELASVDATKAWFDSPDYLEARSVREGAGTWRMIVVTGVDQATD